MRLPWSTPTQEAGTARIADGLTLSEVSIETHQGFSRRLAAFDTFGRHDMARFKEVMSLLIADAPLGAEWLDHPLKGK
jgi:hypothetical protein